MRWRVAMSLVVTTVAVLVALSSVGCDDSSKPTRLVGQVRVTFLHTSDLHSRLFPYNLQIGHIDAGLGLGEVGNISNVGGAARMSHIIGRERARAERVLHLDGGDCFQGAPVFNFYYGEAEIRALGSMGADAMIVANHEFDQGALNLGIQLQRWASFPVLVSNYKLEDPSEPGASPLGTVIQPFTVFDLDGLRVAVLGMGNLSSLTSIYDQPNRLGVLPLKTTEVAQFYIDLLRPIVEMVVVVSHLGIEFDQAMIEGTEGIDIVLGGHNHIVLQPPKRVRDCGYIDIPCSDECAAAYPADPTARDKCVEEQCHFIYLADPGDGSPEDELENRVVRRHCRPRSVLLAHSGAFAKFLGRLDVVASNVDTDMPPGTYDPVNGFEVITDQYRLFPVNETVPEDPIVRRTLEPYAQGLDLFENLDLLIGYAPDGSARFSSTGGDSQLGNMIATAMWLRTSVRTDFALTNTTGIRADVVPGPVNVEQMYNIFPFDNSITKMQLSGVEVQELFDFVSRRSAGRGCTSQAQIAGARVVIDCVAQDAIDTTKPPGLATFIYIGSQQCTDASDCLSGNCDGSVDVCRCTGDADCGGGVGSCDGNGICWQSIDPYASYELATSNYLAGGGSGFRVLQRNTTQFDTKIQQRDALIDYIRGGNPCGSDAAGNVPSCATDADCAEGFVCTCPEAAFENGLVCATDNGVGCVLSVNPGPGDGQCVLARCRDDVADFQRAVCERAPTEQSRLECLASLSPCATGGEQCKFLACIDTAIGNVQDNRVRMVGK